MSGRATQRTLPLRAASALLVALLSVWTLIASSPAQAHKSSDAHLALSAQNGQLALRWDIALRDLDMLLALDADHDGRLSWGEVRRRHTDIDRAARDALALRTDAGACAIGDLRHALVRHSDGTYAVIDAAVRCAPGAGGDRLDRVELSYRLFAGLDPSHRAIVRHAGRSTVVAPDGVPVRLDLAGTAAGTAIASSAGTQASTAATQSTTADAMLSHIGNGMHHILIGADHLAFIVLLLLPCVLQRRDGRWQAQLDAGTSLRRVLLTVTAFTLAHSVTLSAAALHWLTPPSRWVESMIALSIVVAALMNLRGARAAHWWPVAMVFGLVHGFGFATALNDAGLTGAALGWGLVGFNIGVELGQLAFIALLWPLIWFSRNLRRWSQIAVPALSLLLALFGGAWLIERAFDVNLLL